MVMIDVKRELGSDIVTREHGRRLRDLIFRAWEEGPVVVDFNGLQITSVSFLDEAFGQIALSRGAAELDRKVQLKNLDRFDQALLADILQSRSREARRRISKRQETPGEHH